MEQRVKEFFLQYERANSSSDVSEISRMYANTFMFGGPKGVQAVKKEEFLKVVPKMKSYFSSAGLSETRLQSVEANLIDSRYRLVKVAWRMKLQTSSGIRHLDTLATYILEQENEDSLLIVFQIDHQDLASVVKGLRDNEQ